MKTSIATFVLLVLASAAPAYAWECPVGAAWDIAANACIVLPAPSTTNQSQTQGQGQVQNANSSSTSSAAGGAGGVGGSGGNGGSGGSSHSTATGGAATNAGNTQSTNYSSASTYNEVRQAVDGYSSGSNNTSGCVLEQHAGIGAVIGGLSFGHGRRDKNCARQQLAIVLWARGETEAGNRIYCSIDEVKDALGNDCLELLSVRIAVERPAGDGHDYVTPEQLQEVENRITRHMVQK